MAAGKKASAVRSRGWPVRHIPPYRTGQQAVQDGGHAENGIVAEGGEQAADEIGGEAHHRPGNGAEQQARQHDRHGLQRDTVVSAGMRVSTRASTTLSAVNRAQTVRA